MGNVAQLVAAQDWRSTIADQLEEIAHKLRAGEKTADKGVLILISDTEGICRVPTRLGAPMSTSDAMGVMSFGQIHLFQDEVR